MQTTELIAHRANCCGQNLVVVRYRDLLRRKRRAATAATGRVRIRKREARTHYAGDVIDFDAIQILTAEHVDEKLDAALVENEITLARILFDVQAILKTRTTAGHYADAKTNKQ